MVEPVRVALVHRYFDPDMTTYGEMLDRFARHLAGLGHEVTIVTTQPSYNQTYSGPALPRVEVRDGPVTVRRLRIPGIGGRRGKTIGSLLFPLVAALHLVTRRRAYEMVSVSTMPPVVMGVAGRVAKLRSRNARLIYHCMDLYPEVAVAMGMLRGRALPRLAETIDRSTMRASDRVIVLSDDMAATLDRRGVTDRVAVCNNFILEPASHSTAGRGEGPFRLVFAGNLGRFQAIDTLLDAARRVGRSRADFELVFMGAGAMADTITAASADGAPVRLESFRPLTEAMAYVSSADAAVVSVAPGVLDAAFPSKLMTYLEVGVPVVAVCEGDSSLAMLVRDHGLGVVAPNDDPEALADALVALMAGELPDPAHLRQVGRDHFDTDRVLDRWTELYGLAPHPTDPNFAR